MITESFRYSPHCSHSRIHLELVRSFLDIDSRRWGHCLHAPHSLDRSSARLVDIGNALLNYRLSIQQTVPTRMKVLYSWNLDNWHAPKQPKRDARMRKCKRLLAKGPICLQETKWSASEKEVLLQHIPGLQIAESLATPTPGGHWSGGVAVLVPPGYVLKDSHNLVQNRAVAALIADRTSQYYIVSVYLHPDRVRQDLAALCQALQGLACPDSRIILAGDFNRADERCAGFFFFCGCRARSKLRRSSIHWLRLSIPTHENKVKRYLRCLPSNNQAATNTNKQQKQKPNSPTKKQANNKQKTGHLVRRVKHYAFRKVPMPLSTASRWNSNITHIYPTYPKVIIHCMWQWYKSYWATPGVGSSYQNCSTVIATTASRCPINLSHCSSM